jgi:hypothetical protein
MTLIKMDQMAGQEVELLIIMEQKELETQEVILLLREMTVAI